MRPPRAPKPVTPRSLEASAVWHLSRRALSVAQLRAILERKIARAPEVRDNASVDVVLAKMTRLGFLDDARVAHARVHALRARGESKRKIVQRMRMLGVDTAHVDTALTDVDALVPAENDAELAAARVYARRRRLHAKDPQKALAALARQGFSFSTAKRALDGADP